MEYSSCDIALPKTVEEAILYAVAYADVFDYPLTAAQIHRYLVGVPAPLTVVQDALRSGRLTCSKGYFTLPGREAIVETRLQRAEIAAEVWPQAVRYSQAIANLPFVRMVAVTGALAMDNVEPETDIDYLVVTEPGRLWLCRAMVIALVVKPVARQGIEICPNYLLSERALAFSPQNLFTAHEVAQMVPIAGLPVYRRLREINVWTTQFLPNARDTPRPRIATSNSRHLTSRLAETILRTPPGGWMERWEMERKLRKLSQQHPHQGDAHLNADWCKGHFDSHRQEILNMFVQRLEKHERADML
jgi:hypothetical protein